MPLCQKTLRGRIGYIRADGTNIGREWFTITIQPDGTRTMRAQCEMDDVELLRDVTHTVDCNWQPQDAYVRISRSGDLIGAAWYWFSPQGAECEAYTVKDGRVSQSMDMGTRPLVFGAHPVTMDAMTTAAYDLDGPSGIQTISPCASSSPAADGGTGPALLQIDKRIDFLGRKEIEVPAGRFETLYFHTHLEHFDEPLEIFVLPEHHTLVRLDWAHTGAYYVLEDWETLDGTT